jgi:hypothetical protein
MISQLAVLMHSVSSRRCLAVTVPLLPEIEALRRIVEKLSRVSSAEDRGKRKAVAALMHDRIGRWNLWPQRSSLQP